MAVAICSATLAFAGPASAQSTSDFASVWEFNGGQVGVIKNPDKSFTGIVVRPTKTGACVHPVGEQMWTGVRLTGNLTWAGKHVWFLTNPCRLAPATGNTAWKIFKNPGGKTFLRGCYANWALPAIAPVFSTDPATPGSCDPGQAGAVIDSDYIPRKKGTFKAIAKFPKAKCLGKKLKLKFVDPPADALATVQVRAGKFKKTLTRGKLTLTLEVAKGAGKVKVSVAAKTLLKHRIKGSKTYRTC